MNAILGLLCFCGLTGVAYGLFYRLLWSSVMDKPTGPRHSTHRNYLANQKNQAQPSPGISRSQPLRDTTIKAMSSSTDAPPKNL